VGTADATLSTCPFADPEILRNGRMSLRLGRRHCNNLRSRLFIVDFYIKVNTIIPPGISSGNADHVIKKVWN
jgi:hypothetical protein